MCDYSDTAHKIFLNGYLVRSLTIIGIAAEYFWKLAIHDRRGFNCLSWSDVESVELRDVVVNDRNRSLVEVSVPRRDAEIALQLAHAVVELLEQKGFRMLDAIVPQRDASGNKVGEHDLVAERSGPSGKSSIEIKCRTILDDRRRDEVRRQVQKDAYKWWPTAIARPRHGWGERACVLVEFRSRDADNSFAIRCETLPADLPNEAPNWKPLVGWRSRLTNSTGASSAQAPAPKWAPTRPASQPADQIAIAARKRAFSSIYAKCRSCTLYGQEMRSVSDMVTDMDTAAAKRARPTIGERMPVWAKRFKWAPRSWARTPHMASRTGGGRKGIAASKVALEDIHTALS